MKAQRLLSGASIISILGFARLSPALHPHSKRASLFVAVFRQIGPWRSIVFAGDRQQRQLKILCSHVHNGIASMRQVNKILRKSSNIVPPTKIRVK